MKYRKFGKLDYKVSALGFGSMRLPTIEGKIDEPEAIKMLRFAIDKGVNYVDTAYRYHDGQSEVLVGKALEEGYREKVLLATKLPSWLVEKYSDFDQYLGEQLERLKTKAIDFYLLHTLNKNSWPKLKNLGILDWAKEAEAKGLFQHLAFSFHDDLETFKEIVDAYHWPMCQIQYNFMDIKTQAGMEGLRYAANKGIAVVIMEPLLGGNLAEPPADIQLLWSESTACKTPVDGALQWLWNQAEVSTVLSGMSSMDQVVANIDYAARSGIHTLNNDELLLIEKIREKYEALSVIPCTRCGYCMPCPQNVDIPQNFANYNNGIRYSCEKGSQDRYKFWKAAYENHGMLKNDIRAASCIACGECEIKCPQTIAISKWMPIIHDILDNEKPFIRKLDT